MANDNGSVLSEGMQFVPPHPYYPLGVVIEGYVANEMTTVPILAYFATACISALTLAHFFIRWSRPALARGEYNTAMWFVLCGCIHMFLEGYFAWNHLTLGSDSSIIAEMWKEYSLSDSRYLTSDAFVTCMESLTAFLWGPLSIACVFLIVWDHPLRHQLQTIISVGQLYGVVLYYGTCWFEEHYRDTVYSIPHQAYFWGYYVLLNAFWVFIPTYLIWSSTVASCRAFANLSRPKVA